MMPMNVSATLTRRRLHMLGLAGAAALAAPGAAGFGRLRDANAATPVAGDEFVPPTPECIDDDDLDTTQAQTAGPFFTPDSPERTSLLEEGMAGERIILTGYVYSLDCTPVANALLDFWHADDAGVYDNEGYRLRGHQFADENGMYRLETIYPGLYPGRTRHIHLNVQAPDASILTTQLYFPDEPENENDGIYDQQLLVEWMDRDVEDAPRTAVFNFVVETAE